MSLAYKDEYPVELLEKWQQEKIDRYNSTREEATDGIECDICLNKGFIMRSRGLGYVFLEPCICRDQRLQKQRTERAVQESGMHKRFMENSFTNFRIWAPWAGEMKELALSWAKGETGWLLLCGQSGCGKTHLGIAACGWRLHNRGQQVEIISWRDLFGRQARGQNKDEMAQRIEDLKRVSLLYLDDFLKTARTNAENMSWELDLAFELLDYRYNEGLDTILSTELTPKQLLALDEALGSRILTQAQGHIYVTEKTPTKNYRLARR